MSRNFGVVATFSSWRRRFAMSDRETRVRERAHQLWEQEGRPHGRDSDHWEQAAREIDAEENPVAAKKKAPRARKNASAPDSSTGLRPARKKSTK
jgi:Protein of unknown function (DUF2934)